MLIQNHYETLGVPRGATLQEIKQAFRSLAIRYHPDVTCVNKSLAEERFKEISEAYWILKDPKRCMEYDRSLPALIKEVREPPSWEHQEEVEWIWDERQLRYRKKPAYEEGVIEARSPFSFIRRGVVYRRKTRLDKLKERVLAGANPSDSGC